MQFSLLYKQRWSWLYIPILVLSGILLTLAATEWMPLPPRNLSIVAGDQAGNHAQLAKRYRDVLEQKNINASIVYTKDWDELSKTLARPAQTAQLGFAQGLYAKPPTAAIQALAVVAREPVWVFARLPAVTQISQFGGLRVAAGTAGSSAYKVAQLLVAHANAGPVLWQNLSNAAAVNALVEGKLDALVYIGGADSPIVRQLSRTPSIHLLPVEHAVSLAARESLLRAFSLPHGSIELVGDIPPRDLTMMACFTHLLVRESLHPATQRLLIDVATDLHERSTFLQHHSEFPNTREVDFELSPVSKNYTLGVKPFFESVLPYWWAQLAELLVLAVLPILILTCLMLVIIPSLFDLKVTAALQHFYGELKFLEKDIPKVTSDQPIALTKLMGKLDALELQVMSLELPDRYADRWYTLREHLAAARDRLLKSRGR